jgi:2',3'-cyclic-nucleotide 2'-phosphodiesterase (5'-nucleotidase family)
MLKFIYIFIIGAGLLACSSVNTAFVSECNIQIDSTFIGNTQIDSIILPYKDSLEKEMSEVIATSLFDYAVSRPNSNLGNWVADAIFVNQTKNVRLSIPIFCLLNTGGIRSTINKGEVTLGDLYKLMPFDNEVVWVKLEADQLPLIEAYLRASGGEPIANATISDGKLNLNGWTDKTTEFWVITSDYLKNGGDKMSFFANPLEINTTGKLMRDVLIEEARFQGNLTIDSSLRIQF